MTCVVGLVDNDKVYMGADSAGISSWELMIRADRKVFRKDNYPDSMLMAFTSSFRMGQLLRYSLLIPPYAYSTDIDEYMATTFVNAVRQCLKDGGYARKDKEEESAGTFLVGFRRQLFRIDSDYQVGRSVEPFDAVGCGAQVALGSLYTSTGNPEARIMKALLASERFSAGVRAPFHIVTI